MKQSISTIISCYLILILLVGCQKQPTNKEVLSPDDAIRIGFSIQEGKPFYSVSQSGKEMISSSLMGFRLSEKDEPIGELKIENVRYASVDETWDQPWGEEISVRNHYNEMRVDLKEVAAKGRMFSIIFRAFNDGIGFRYEFPEQENLKEVEILDELTEFNLAEDHEAWSIPGLKGEYYEMLYTKSLVSQLDTVSTPLTMETKEGKYITIHEANLTDYAAINLYPSGGSKLKTYLTPWSTGVKVYAEAPFVTPWRTLIFADNLNELANSRIMLNLNEPCAINDLSWIQPAKYIGIWWGIHMEKYTWSQGPKHGATTRNVKQYIDFAAKHNIQGVLVEGWNYGWDEDWSADGDKFKFSTPYPDYDMEELSKYASMRGVKIIGHNETGGASINYENQLEETYAYMKKNGISAVKTGYVSNLLDKKERHSSQYGVRHYRKTIEKAAEYKIMLDIHEPVVQTGLQRTYPNLMTQEGVRGQEYNAWSQDGGNPPEHTTIIPFTRGLAGPMDYTPGIFNFENPVYPQTRVQSTVAKELALYVVLYSPMQMAADLPENYEGKPAFEFIELVPVDWSQTIIKDGKIGDYVVTVRKDKHSDDWFMGAITDEEARTLKVDCSYLDEGKTYRAKLFTDAPDSDWKTNPYPVVIKEIEVNKDSLFDLYLAPGGGCAIHIQALD